MAEKPRIKETDAIYDSIGKRRTVKKPSVVQGDVLPPPIENIASDAGDGSAGKRRGRPRKQTPETAAPFPLEAPPEEPAPQRERDRNPLDFSKYELPQKEKKRGRPRKDAPPRIAPEVAEVIAEEAPPPQAEPAPPAAPAAQAKPARAPAKRTAAPPKKAIVHADEVQTAKVKEFSFSDLEEEQRLEEERKKQAEAERIREQKRLEQERLREKMTRQEKRDQEELDSIRQRGEEEAERTRRQAAEEAERKLREAAEEAARLRQEAEAEAERLRRLAEEEAERARKLADHEAEKLRLEKESRRKLLEDAEYRDDVLGQLGNEFEQQFSKVFADPEAVKKEETPWWLAEKRVGLGKAAQPEAPQPQKVEAREAPLPPLSVEPFVQEEPKVLEEFAYEDFGDEGGASAPAPDAEASPFADQQQPLQEQDLASEQEADDFMRSFEQEVMREENDRDQEEDFRETLAQKFMRERERYLQDLGIADLVAEEEARQEEAERTLAEAEAQARQMPPRRKLDFQIRPELHGLSEVAGQALPDADAGTAPAPARVFEPVTYDRSAQVQTQDMLPRDPVEPVEPPPQEKKSAEELLLELGRMNKRREESKKPKAQKHFNFRFTTMESDAEGEDGQKQSILSRLTPMGKVVTLSAAGGLVLLILLIVLFVQSLAKMEDLQPDNSALPAASEAAGETKVMLDSLNPENTMRFTDVTVKRSGLSFSNLDIAGSLVVEEEASAEGALSLTSVAVGDMIYIKPSGINRLDLKDVTAARVIINNTSKDVAIHVSGASDIGTVEIRTPATVQQSEVAIESPGIRAVQLSAQDAAAPLAVSVDGAKLSALSTEGETQLTFADASVETINAQGNMTLSGSGKVAELNFGFNEGGGATDKPPVAYPASILVKGVEVARLNLKSAATVNLNAQIDSMYTSDPLVLGGNGTIGHLIFNEKFGNGRLTADISGLNIQQLTTNAETLFYARDSATINTLIANESTWALGKKVNKLTANADGVIYENEPDSKQIAQGVDPPQSKADNPNLNYDLSYDFSTGSGTPSTDETEDKVATTCDHSRDVGGFILGDGSRTDPFIVENAAQLAHVAQHTASYFLQADDIDISEDSSFVDGFPMIGLDERFTGVYDGAGYAITNLRVYGEGDDNVGLFATNAGTIRNLNIESGEFHTSDNASVGAFVGMNYSGGVVESCSNGATINAGNSLYSGGIVGYNYAGKIRDCYNTGKILGNTGVGGIVGMNFQDGSVNSCYNVGAVTGETDIGSVAGINEAAITNCYYLEDEEMSGVGTGEGGAVARSMEQLSAEQMASDLKAGNDESLWRSGSADGYSYPVLAKPGGITA